MDAPPSKHGKQASLRELNLSSVPEGDLYKQTKDFIKSHDPYLKGSQ